MKNYKGILEGLRAISEGRDAPLYHFTNIMSFSLILLRDRVGLVSSEVKAIKDLKREAAFGDWDGAMDMGSLQRININVSTDVKPNIVSLTRNVRHPFRRASDVLLVFNQTKLSQRFKMTPNRGNPNYDEAEEIVTGVIKPAGRYIDEVLIDRMTWESMEMYENAPEDPNPEIGDDHLSPIQKEMMEVTTSDIKKYCSRNGIKLTIGNL